MLKLRLLRNNSRILVEIFRLAFQQKNSSDLLQSKYYLETTSVKKLPGNNTVAICKLITGIAVPTAREQ